MLTNNSGYVLIATGEYSDFCTAPFRVLKPFTFEQAAQTFANEWKPGKGWQTKPLPAEFVAWLSANGYVEDASEIQEIHVGSYDEMEIDSDLGRVEFAPRESAL